MFYTSIGDGREGVSDLLEERTPEFAAKVLSDLAPFYDERVAGEGC